VLQRFFDPPTAVVQGAKHGRRESDGVKQRSHHHMLPPVRRGHPHQANRCRRRRALVVLRIARIRRTQAHQLLALPRAHELAYHPESTGNVTANTERDPARGECCRQPAARKAAVEDQQVVDLQPLDHLEEHLALVTRALLQREVKEHLNSRQVQAKRHARDDRTYTFFHRRQPDRRGIASHYPQALPSRHRQMLLDQVHQLSIDVTEHQSTNLVARLAESLGAHQADRVRTISQVGKELVQFSLDRTLYAGQQERQDGWEAERAVAGEILRLETGAFQ